MDPALSPNMNYEALLIACPGTTPNLRANDLAPYNNPKRTLLNP